MTSRTSTGTGALSAEAREAREPSETSSLTNSVRKKGLPSVRARMTSTTPASRGSSVIVAG
jgi:hypothetical protein